jgi:hypothetical protein
MPGPVLRLRGPWSPFYARSRHTSTLEDGECCLGGLPPPQCRRRVLLTGRGFEVLDETTEMFRKYRSGSFYSTCCSAASWIFKIHIYRIIRKKVSPSALFNPSSLSNHVTLQLPTLMPVYGVSPTDLAETLLLKFSYITPMPVPSSTRLERLMPVLATVISFAGTQAIRALIPSLESNYLF